MADAFIYRPKFVDIRVKKSSDRKRASAPEERVCDHVGCGLAGAHRAPKSRDNNDHFWWFCADHAAEYNRRWNYFEGMSEDELQDYARAERAGHRPTWAFRAGRGDRTAASRRGFGGRKTDPFGEFGAEADPEAVPERRVGRLHRLALEALDLDERASPEVVRARYAELVKRYHPDSNGGDRSVEELLNKVIRAYQTLKAAGFA